MDTIEREQQSERVGLELQQAAKRYATILTATSDGFLVVDIATGRLLDVNAAAVRLSGYSRDELLSMRIEDLDIEHDQDGFAAHNKKIFAQGYDLFETRIAPVTAESWMWRSVRRPISSPKP